MPSFQPVQVYENRDLNFVLSLHSRSFFFFAGKLQCIDGVLVGNTCYKLARRVGTGMVYEAARNLCAFNGMTLAEIPSEEVYNAVYNYVKSNWYLTTNAVNRNFVRIWLGSSYRVSLHLLHMTVFQLLSLVMINKASLSWC